MIWPLYVFVGRVTEVQSTAPMRPSIVVRLLPMCAGYWTTSAVSAISSPMFGVFESAMAAAPSLEVLDVGSVAGDPFLRLPDADRVRVVGPVDLLQVAVRIGDRHGGLHLCDGALMGGPGRGRRIAVRAEGTGIARVRVRDEPLVQQPVQDGAAVRRVEPELGGVLDEGVRRDQVQVAR